MVCKIETLTTTRSLFIQEQQREKTCKTVLTMFFLERGGGCVFPGLFFCSKKQRLTQKTLDMAIGPI
jgi:hypothetical protein